MKKILLLLSLLSTSAYGGVCKEPVKQQVKKPSPCHVVKKPAAPKPVATPKAAAAPACTTCESACCDKGDTHVQTGNQTVSVNVQPSAPVVLTRTVYVRRNYVRKTPSLSLNPNRLQLLIGSTKTDHKLIQKSCCRWEAESRREIDFGAQYLRDVGDFTGSITGTVNGSLYLGFGVNW